jgi:hypothetical protein
MDLWTFVRVDHLDDGNLTIGHRRLFVGVYRFCDKSDLKPIPRLPGL